MTKPLAPMLAGLFILASTVPVAAQDVIRIGAPLATTGALADAGMKEEQGYDVAVKAINNRGGVKVGDKHYTIELVKYDYQSQTNRAIQLVQRLITVDHVNFLLSPYGSGDTKATAAIAERYGIPMMAPSAATESVFDQNFKNLFGLLFANHYITDAELAYMHGKVPNAMKIALLALNSLYPKSIAGEMRTSATKAGYQIVFDGIYAPNASDFADSLTQIKSAAPDWIYVTGYTQDLISVRRQMVEQNLSAPIITMTAGPAYPEFKQNLGAAANNVTTDSWWWSTADYNDPYLFESAKGYADAFRRMFGHEPSYLEAAATASCEVLAQAIEAAGTLDPAAVREQLAGHAFQTFYGPVQFGPTGQNSKAAAVVMQIQNENIIILAPDNLKQGDLVVGVKPQ